MSKHPKEKRIPFIYKDLPNKVFCPACHRPVKVVVPAQKHLYLVHDTDDICAVDNEQGNWNG